MKSVANLVKQVWLQSWQYVSIYPKPIVLAALHPSHCEQPGKSQFPACSG